MDTNVASFVDKLKAKQGDMNDVAFAKKLGLSRQTWAFLKDGTRHPGKRSIKKILAAYPEFALDIMNYLTEDNSKTK